MTVHSVFKIFATEIMEKRGLRGYLRSAEILSAIGAPRVAQEIRTIIAKNFVSVISVAKSFAYTSSK